MQQNEEKLYERYCRTGRKFEIIGGAVFAVGAAAHLATGGHLLIAMVEIAGLALLVFGAMNLRPANMIKAFAMQLQATSDRDFAQGLLEAMEKNGNTGMTRNSLSTVQMAIQTYAASPEADEALVEQLFGALKKHLRRVAF